MDTDPVRSGTFLPVRILISDTDPEPDMDQRPDPTLLTLIPVAFLYILVNQFAFGHLHFFSKNLKDALKGFAAVLLSRYRYYQYK